MSSRDEAIELGHQTSDLEVLHAQMERILDALHDAGLIVWADEYERFGYYCESDGSHDGEVVSACEHPVGTTERSYKFPVYRKAAAS